MQSVLDIELSQDIKLKYTLNTRKKTSIFLANFPFPSRPYLFQPSHSLLFPFPTFPLPYLSPSFHPYLSISLPTYQFPYLPIQFPLYLSTSIPTYLLPSLPTYQFPSLPIQFPLYPSTSIPTYLLLYLSTSLRTFPPSLSFPTHPFSFVVTLPLYFLFSPSPFTFLFPLFLFFPLFLPFFIPFPSYWVFLFFPHGGEEFYTPLSNWAPAQFS